MRALVSATLLGTLACSASAQTLDSTLVATGLGIPTAIRWAPGDDARIFVASAKRGVHVIEDGVLRPELFLDLDGIINTSTVEGLLSMAFHPDYQANGKFYVVYLDVNLESSIVEYQVSADPNLADPGSANLILGPAPQPSTLHNWNDVVFGPDDKLYILTGDGFAPGMPGSIIAQDLGSLFGKVLRLDVDLPSPHIPPDNPFVGQPGARGEVWAYGLRQPWRLTFDRATGDMYIGEVGIASWEEVDFVPGGSPGGMNFGWPCMEGLHCRMNPDCSPMCGDPSWVEPIHEYAHSQSTSCVIGGYVYRGSQIPGLDGTYFLGDNREGRVWSFRYDGTTLTDFQERTLEIGPPSLNRFTTFGEDNQGELYFGNLDGRIYKIIERPDCGTLTYCLSNPNSNGTAAVVSSAGSTSIAADDLELQVAGAVPGSLGLFFYGDEQFLAPLGHGFRCVNGQIFRLGPPSAAGPDGSVSRALDVANLPAPAGDIVPGSRWFFQYWYRDPAAQQFTFNMSDGLDALFCP